MSIHDLDMDLRHRLVAALRNATRQIRVVCGESGVLDGAKIAGDNEIIKINHLIKLPDGCRFIYDVNYDRLEEILRDHLPHNAPFWATERDYIRLFGPSPQDRVIRLRCDECPNKVNGCRVAAVSGLTFPNL